MARKSLILNIGSRHNGTESSQSNRETGEEKSTRKKYNEDNKGIGLKYRLKNNKSVEGGYYKNSLDKDTFYIEQNKSFPFRLGKLKVSPGLSLGAATGYKDGLVPYLTPTLEVGNKYKLRLRYIPKIEGVTPEVYGLQAEFPL